ncbi:MAG: hypothetical protein JKY02_00920 [Flavobacteriaceae bacterium]|nr:hypothetical protein [Flavobacteriaceae bacterium]
MKKSFLLLCLTIIILSCDSPEKKKENIIKKEAPKEIVVEKKVKKVKKVDNTLLRLKRNPCSGDCPVFEVNISKDSVLTYKGIQFTNIMGVHRLKLSASLFTKLTSILEASNFSRFKNRYTTSGTKDFAETIISYKGKNVTVRLWKDAPKKLTAIYVFIEDLLYDHKYLE